MPTITITAETIEVVKAAALCVIAIGILKIARRLPRRRNIFDGILDHAHETMGIFQQKKTGPFCRRRDNREVLDNVTPLEAVKDIGAEAIQAALPHAPLKDRAATSFRRVED